MDLIALTESNFMYQDVYLILYCHTIIYIYEIDPQHYCLLVVDMSQVSPVQPKYVMLLLSSYLGIC